MPKNTDSMKGLRSKLMMAIAELKSERELRTSFRTDEEESMIIRAITERIDTMYEVMGWTWGNKTAPKIPGKYSNERGYENL